MWRVQRSALRWHSAFSIQLKNDIASYHLPSRSISNYAPTWAPSVWSSLDSHMCHASKRHTCTNICSSQSTQPRKGGGPLSKSRNLYKTYANTWKRRHPDTEWDHHSQKKNTHTHTRCAWANTLCLTRNIAILHVPTIRHCLPSYICRHAKHDLFFVSD